MTKVAVLNYLENSLAIITISDELMKYYEDDIEICLIENSVNYNTIDCRWMEIDTDAIGNIHIIEEILSERKE